MLSKAKILLLFLWVLTPANAGIVPLGAAQQCPLSLAPLYERELGLLCSLDEPDANQSQPLPAVPPSVPASWQQGSVCHGSGEDKFCGFTKKSFGGGEGVSLITTLERIASLASGQLSDAAEPAHGPARPGAEAAGAKPYVEAEIPGKGVGLVASGPIRTGQLVMARTPAVMVDGRALQAMGEDEMGELLGDAVAGLPAPHRARYLNLTTHSSVRSHRERVRNIFGVNRFRTRILDGGPDFHAVFTEISRLNHECRPNCAYYFDPATLTQKVHAVRDILPGEELTVSYIDGFQESKARQRQLHEFWGFQCSCRLCMAESHLVEESDSRIAQVKKLWSELDDYSATSTATPEKAELLIQLYQLEGLDGRLQEAYYRAAIEWSGVGNAVQAVKYARLCLQSGLTFKGPGKPFIVSMQELVKDPEAHRTWRSRIRDTSMAEQK